MVIESNHNLVKQNLNSSSLVNNIITSTKTNVVVKNSVSSFCNKFRNHKPSNEIISPYLNGAKIQMLSQMTAKKLIQRKTMDVSLSFSQANKIYKANSDELRSAKVKTKRNKLSCSTASNELSKIQQTVSDMNDSDYCNAVNNKRKSSRKRRPSNKCCRNYNNNNKYEFYNGDLILKSKTDKKYDSKRQKPKRNLKSREPAKASDVWAMLRNMNRFHHISSPPLSDDSYDTMKNKGSFSKYPNKAGVIETTEEFSFISSYDIKNKSQSNFSQKSSLDRVTIIERKSDLSSQELIQRSIPNTLSTQFLNKKSKNKRKCHVDNKEIQNSTSTIGHEICMTENRTKDCLNTKSNDIRNSSSKQCLNKMSNCDVNEQLGKNLNSINKNKCTKKQLLQSKCGNEPSLTELPDSENQYSEDSDISSKDGLKGLYGIKVVNKSRANIENTLEDNVNSINKGFKEVETQKKNQCLLYKKLRITEIRRQLARLKFPIVILNKDEISSTFQVVDYEPPQFNGLDRTIWPFMIEWSQNLEIIKSRSHINNLGSPIYLPEIEENIVKNKDDVNETSKTILKQINVNEQIKSAKPKVLGQFKNKIMDLICNKSQKSLPIQSNVKVNNNPVLNKNILKHKRSKANTKICEQGFENKKPYHENIETKKSVSSYKTIYPRSKGKWAGDFIDNIINKIKKGVYYNQDSDVCEEIKSIDMALPVEPENITNQLISRDAECACIPGFDHGQDFKTLKLEVKMVTRTQISIHHCLTNVVLQFDLSIPLGTDSTFSSTISSLPAPTNGQMCTLYRWKTRIPNAIMPGELCSILPKLLNEIMNGNDSNLIRPDNISTPETKKLKQIECATITIHPEVTRLMNGAFCNYHQNKPLKHINNNKRGRMLLNSNLYQMENKCLSVKHLLGYVNCIYDWIRVQNKSLIKTIPQHNSKIIEKPLQQCMALVRYTPPKATSTPELHSSLFTNLSLNNGESQKIEFGDITVRLHQFKTIMDSYTNIIKMAEIVTPSRPIILSICSKPQNSPEYIQSGNEIKDNSTKSVKLCVKSSVKSRKSYKKRKPKAIRSNSCTSLSRINNIKDFFSALGWCKTLSIVLQGYSEKNILSSIIEMKNWIKEITPAQALLVLLLSNKKETLNLKRFRPMLLQGIAVNRITTADELDMEIEVIEKENLCISQNEGISFLSGCNDNLLEELCWIAKTTASDHQKPFDESSKKLLKTLLGKRKKLSPSYLRVMARYVGLGLLKHGGT